MSDITVEHNASPVKLDQMEVESWPVWEKEISTFDWRYEQNEVCYILEGTALVTPKDGTPVEINEGDLVTFAEGLSCVWEVKEPMRKHYWLK